MPVTSLRCAQVYCVNQAYAIRVLQSLRESNLELSARLQVGRCCIARRQNLMFYRSAFGMTQQPGTLIFRAICLCRVRCSSLPTGLCILTQPNPVQRITRYPLLIKQVNNSS